MNANSKPSVLWPCIFLHWMNTRHTLYDICKDYSVGLGNAPSTSGVPKRFSSQGPPNCHKPCRLPLQNVCKGSPEREDLYGSGSEFSPIFSSKTSRFDLN